MENENKITCEYCNTVYESNLNRCPNCHGSNTHKKNNKNNKEKKIINKKISLEDRFVEIEWCFRWKIYVDKKTRVQYLYNHCKEEKGMTVLLDENGKPLLYEGELD